MRTAKNFTVPFVVALLFIITLTATILCVTGGRSALSYGDGISVVGPDADNFSTTSTVDSYTNYTHGSNVKNNTSGTAIPNEISLRDALNSGSGTYYLSEDVTLSASDSFDTGHTFGGTLYGNGHTVTITGKSGTSTGQTQVSINTSIGGLVSELTGKIYDLNVKLAEGTYANYIAGAKGTVYLGGIAGKITNGGVIENCTFTLPSGSRIQNLSYGEGYWPCAAVIAGYVESATLKDITVINNGTVRTAVASGTSSAESYKSPTSYNYGIASNLIGYIGEGDVIADNLIFEGNGTVEGFYAANCGMTASGAANVVASNIYNKFTGTISATSNGGSEHFVKYLESSFLGGTTAVGNISITNYYAAQDAKTLTNSYKQAPANSVTVSGYSVYFNPAAESVYNSLVVEYLNQSKPASLVDRVWTLSGNSYSKEGVIIEGEDTDTVVFYDMPTAAATWSVNGAFTATLSYTDTLSADFGDLTRYEHGYVPEGYQPAGTAITSGSEFYNKVIMSDVDASTQYYLTDDVLITGFSECSFAGTLDGNGKTIYITAASSGLSKGNIGGLVGTLSGTIKNVRIVILSEISVNMANVNTENNVGVVAGEIAGGSIENVSVVIPTDTSVTLTDNNNNCSLGGITGKMSGISSISNTTLQLDGSINIAGTYVFLGGFIGSYQRNTQSTLTLTNNILKGTGQFGGDGTDSAEPKHVAAIAVVRSMDKDSATLTIDGFIYSLHSADGNNTDYVPVGGKAYCSYGYVVQNNAGDNVETNGKPADQVGVNYSNIFEYNAVMNAKGGMGSYNGNTFVAVTTSATVDNEIADVSGSTVTPYFMPGSTDSVTLVASAPADGWGDVTVIESNGSDTGVFSTDGELKVVTVAKQNAASDGSVSLHTVQTVSAPQNTGTYRYTGTGIDATIQMMLGEELLGSENYTLSYSPADGDLNASLKDGKPLTAGDYIVKVTLNDGYLFYIDGVVSDVATVEISVAKAQTNVVVNAPAQDYDGNEYDGTITVTMPDGDFSAEDLGAITWEYKAESADVWTEGLPTDAGEYAIRIKSFDNIANFELSGAECTLTINRKVITLDVVATEGAKIVYGTVYDAESAKALVNVTCAEDGIGVEYTVTLTVGEEAYSSGTPAGVQVSASVNATLTGSKAANYTFSEPATVTFEVQKKEVKVTANDAEREFGDENPSFGYEVTSGEFYEEFTVSFTCAAIRTSNAGETFDIVPEVSMDTAANYEITYFNGTLTIIPKTVEILKAQDLEVDYSGGVVQNDVLLSLFDVPSDINGMPLFLVFEVTKDGESATAQYAGQYVVTASLAEYYENEDGERVSQTNYTAGSCQATLTVKAKEIDIVLSDAATFKTYDGIAVTEDYLLGLFEMQGVYEEGGAIVLVVSVDEGEVRNAGTYTVNVSLHADALKMYAISSSSVISVSYTIYKVVVDGGISAPANPVYDKTVKEAAFAFKDDVSPMVGADEILLSYKTSSGQSIENIVSAGTYSAIASLPEYEAGKSNYEWAESAVSEYEFVISPAQIEVMWSDDVFVYNGAEQKPVAGVTGIGGDEINVTVTVEEGEAINSGTYTAIASTDNTNYTFINAEKKYEIARAALDDLNVTTDGWVYGDEAAIPVVEGNTGNGTVTYRYESTDGKGYDSEIAPTDAGTYRLTVIVAETVNYQTGSASYEFTIAKKQIAKPTEDESYFVYTGEMQTYNPIGFVEENMFVKGNVQSGANESGYAVVVSLANPDNYEWADGTSEDVTFSFVIEKAELTDSTADVTAVYDGAAHGISVVVDGFVNGENFEIAGGKVEYSANGNDDWTSANIFATNVEQTPLTVYYRISFENYKTVVGNATVTVNAKEISIDGVKAVTREYDGTTSVELVGGYLVGVVESDEVTFVLGDGIIGDANAGADKTVTTAISLTGADAGNYKLSQPEVVAEILPRTVAINAGESFEREYDKDIVTSDFSALFTAPLGIGEDGELSLVYTVIKGDIPVIDGIKDAGTYTVTANLAVTDGNYTASAVSVIYTVTVRKIAKPIFEAPVLTYNGQEQSIVLDENDYYILGGTLSATGAGSYSATVTLVDTANTAWEDETSATLNYEWSIAKATPVVSVSVTLPEEGLFASDEELPDIRVLESSVSGSVVWDEGQSLVAGSKPYLWTFTPDDTDNYNTVSGEENLTVTPVEIDSIAVTKMPDKVVYEYGDEFDKTGMEVTVTYNNHATKVVTDFSVNVTVLETLGDNVAIKVIYEGKETEFTVKVVKKNIAKPDFTVPEYVYNGSEQAVAVAESEYYTVDGTLVATNAGKYTVTVTLDDGANMQWADGSVTALVFEWTIEKADATVTPVVSTDGTLFTSDSLPEITTAFGDTEGTIKWNDGQILVAGKKEYAWTFVPDDVINYNGVSGTITLTVEEVEAVAVEITVQPYKTVYEYGDEFDRTGMELTVKYNNGDIITTEDYTVDVTVFRQIGDSVSVTVSYEGMTDSFTVCVTKKTITIVGVTAVTREYDGTTSVILNGGSLIGVVEGDDVAFVLGVGTLESADAGSDKSVSTAIVLSGVDAENYELTQPNDVKAVINKAKPTVNPVIAEYDVIYTSGILPAISLSEGDTDGVITWDSDQDLVAGETAYSWTFVPADNANYIGASGTCLLTVTEVALTSITAVFDAGDVTIYASASVESLREYLTVTGVNNDGTPYEGEIEYTLDGIIRTGECTITVKVVGSDISTTFKVLVSETAVTGIEIVEQPSKTVYTAFENFDKTGMIVYAMYADGISKPITDYAIEGGDDLNVGIDKVTVKFEGFSADIAITVNPLKVTIPSPSATAFVYNAQSQGIELDESAYYTISGTLTATDAGEYSVTVNLNDVVNTVWTDGNVDAIVIGWNIGRADYDMSGVSFADGSKEYDGTVQTLAIEGELPTGADGLQVKVTYSAGRKDVGTVVVTATFVTTSTNYNTPAAMSATLTITVKAVQVVWQGQDGLIYNGTEQKPVAVVDSGIIGETVEVNVTVDGNAVDAGAYTATAVLVEDNGNFVLTDATIEYVIAQAVFDAEDIDVPDDIEYSAGQSLDELELPVGWRWVEGSLKVKENGDTVATAVFISADGNYVPYEVEIVLAKAEITPTDPAVPEDNTDSPSIGLIVGIAVGVAVLLAVIIIVAVVVRKKKKA